MRRKMSALTTTILGAVVTASTVSAQQLPPSNQAPRNKATAPEPATATAPEPENEPDPLFGMVAMRGARYLLRNGLDYLNYQQYERALKFLREAENRQKELNKSEKLALKQGIERAQRGMRDAADAESPYAISDRSHPRNGFIAAKPDIQVSSNTDRRPNSPTPKAGPLDQPTGLGGEGEDRGEPIRLASADFVSRDPVSQPVAGQSPGKTTGDPSDDRSGVARQGSLPEIPLLPAAPKLSDLTDSNSSLLPSPSASDQGPAQAPQPQQPVAAAAASPAEVITSLPPLDPATEPAAPSQGQAGNIAPFPKTKAGDASDAAAVRTSQKPIPVADSTPPIQAAVQPSGVQADEKDKEPQSLALAGDGRTIAIESTSAPAVSADTAPSAAPVEPTPSPAPVNATPSSAPGDSAVVSAPVEPTPSPAPVEIKKPAPAPVEVSPSSAPVATPSTSSGLVQTAGSKSEAATSPTKPAVIDLERISLPPLANNNAQPDNAGDLAHKETEGATLTSMPDPSKSAAPVSTADTPLLTANPGDTNDLPPLPPELGNSEASRSAAVASPAQAISPGSLATVPAATGQPGEQAPTHAEDERPTTPPAVTEPRPAPPTAMALPEAQPVPAATNTAGPEPAPAPAPAPSAAVTDLDLPPLPGAGAAAPAPTQAASPAPAQGPTPAPTQASDRQPYPSSNPNLEREPEAVGLETGVGTAPGGASTPPASSSRKLDGTGFDPFSLNRAATPSTLRPELQRQVEEIARRQEEALRRQVQNPPPSAALARDSAASDLRAQTQLDISRAPSPAEARPIKAIPVPEDWVPLAQRDWTPQRKYWAAAATCHLPLYFQDPVLERYGHSVEQFVGPIGRYLSYPVDDPTQSTQRNQIIQPFFSIGLFSLQILAWPYNLIVDPPWEAQYDLGYYRPGDPIPTDLYWLPLHGYGPPLHGSRY